MPVSAQSLSATSLNDRSGARTGLASLTSGVTVLLALLFLAPLFSSLPKPVLSALIIEAVVMGMMDLGEMRRLRRVSRADFWVAGAAILGTLVFGILAGVVIGIALSLVWLVYVVTHPLVSTLGRSAGTQVFRDLDTHPEDETTPGIVVLRMDGGVFFATADAFVDQVRATVLDPGVRSVVLHFAGVNFMDSQGAATVSGADPDGGGVGCGAAVGGGPAGGATRARAGRCGGPVGGRSHPRQRPPSHGRAGSNAAPCRFTRPGTPRKMRDSDHMSDHTIHPSAPAVVPRWEWRTFGEDLHDREALAPLGTVASVESDETYLLSMYGDASVKVRDGVLDVKVLQQVSGAGLQLWVPTMKAPFPPMPKRSRAPSPRSACRRRRPGGPSLSLEQLLEDLVAPRDDLRAVEIHKRRRRSLVDDCMLVEPPRSSAEGITTRTVAVESPDPDLVSRTIARLGLEGRPDVCVARGLKSMLGWGPRRFAVIDVGTNSVKFALGRRDEGGTPRLEVETAVVTRLGEGLVAAGTDRRLDGPHGRRHRRPGRGRPTRGSARHRRRGYSRTTAGIEPAPLPAAVHSRCGVTVEVISGRDEADSAYMAAVSTLPLTGDRLLVFDSGGGSSQFTFGSADRIEEQFSVDVGAVRFAERFGLADAVPRETVDAALDAIAAELADLANRPRPDMVIAIGGTSTNLAAIKHGLADYDPDVVHGTVIDADEVDRQIEAFRTRSAQERREIAGLQPARAEVILAGGGAYGRSSRSRARTP